MYKASASTDQNQLKNEIKNRPNSNETNSSGDNEDGDYDDDDEFDDGDSYCESSSDEEVEKYEQCDCVDENSKKAADKIPYVSIYESSDDAEKRGYLIPSKPVKATILSVEREESTLFNSYVYTIDLEHGYYKWTIQRRYKDFQHLHNRLLLFRTTQQVVAPMRRFDRTLPYDDGSDGLHEITFPFDEDSSMGKVNKGLDVNELADVSAQAVALPMSRRETKQRDPKLDSDTGSTVVDQGAEGKPVIISSGEIDTIIPVVNGRSARRHRPHHHRVHKLPNFPFVPDSMIGPESIDVRKNELQRYISRILHIPAYRNHKETASFMEVSRLSFVNNLGVKTKEGLVKKRPGGRKTFHGVSRFCIERCAKWSKRWLIVKDSFIAYIHPRSNLIRFVMLYDNDFQVKTGGAHLEGLKCGLLISNLQRELLLRVETEEQAAEWKEIIDRNVAARGRIWLDTHQFGSTYPIREPSYAHWFVDGKTYMEHVANMMELANEEILITDWWLSPEIYLKRPMFEGNRWRLDEILKRKAQKGVRIFVLLYKEVEMALGIKSGYSKQILQLLHPNIRVLRHPDHVPGATATVLWAHHEKVVVIDQNIAFIGGIDMCYGRWDDHRHKLIDTGSITYGAKPSLANLQGKNLLSGMKAMAQVLPMLTMVESDAAGRTESTIFNQLAPTEDVPTPGSTDGDSKSIVERKGEGPSSSPYAKNRLSTESTDSTAAKPALRGWARVKRIMSAPSEAAIITGKRRSEEPPKTTTEQPDSTRRFNRLMSTPDNRLDLAEVVKKYKEYVDSGRMEQDKVKGNTPPLQKKPMKMIKVLTDWKRRLRHRDDYDAGMAAEYEEMWSHLQEEAQLDMGLAGAGKIWMGKDYVNFIFKDFTDLEMPYHDFIDRAVMPRMPWHDISSVVYGSAARDTARHFIQRWNMCKVEKAKYDDSYPYLVPKSYENVQVPKVFRQISHRCKVQILRSGAAWSCGMNHTEDSIHEAYIHMISNAKHYIYIENQFFISLVDSPEVHNRICKTLCDRIIKAHKQNETFRVYILLPLLPGFEGSLGTTGGSALQAVLYWTYKSISKGPHSLVGYLSKEMDNYGQYLTFCSLRTHGVLCDRLITELVYIHSKMIVVDDKYCLISSANINDRSQMGKRDSEVAIYIEDSEFEPSKMNGQSYKAGRFSSSIRRQLFREHLGLLDDSGRPKKGMKFDVSDPVSDTFWNKFKDIAKRNTHIYENVFRCFPTDEVKSFEQLESYRNQISMADFNRAAAEQELSHVRGYLVQFPISFLCNSDLAPSLKTKEGLAPISLFT